MQKVMKIFVELMTILGKFISSLFASFQIDFATFRPDITKIKVPNPSWVKLKYDKILSMFIFFLLTLACLISV